MVCCCIDFSGEGRNFAALAVVALLFVVVAAAVAHKSKGRQKNRRCIKTCFRDIKLFPVRPTVRVDGTAVTRHGSTEKRSNRAVIFIAKTRRVSAFGVRRPVVRVSVVLVAHAIHKRNVPRVYAKQVVQLVDAELAHFAGLEAGTCHCRERGALLLDIGSNIGVSQYFKDVASLITIV